MIKGFVGNDSKVSVFNIEKNQLENARKSPKQIFFEWNRNTFNLNGEDSDFVERLFQFGENQFAPVYKRISESNGTYEFTPTEIFHIAFFIGVLYYRLPNNDNDVRSLIQNMNNKDLHFKIENKETKEEAPIEHYHEIMSNPAFIESSRIILAVRDYLATDMVSNIDHWKVYYAGSDVHLHLLSDNPIIFRNNDYSNILENELIFPFSRGKTIYHSKGKIVKQLPPQHRLKVDILTFLQAERMVCGPNGDYLNAIAKLSQNYKNPREMKRLKEEIFSIFE
jgi:hypothetical protein